MHRHIFAFLLMTLTLWGCSHSIKMNPNIHPNVYIANKRVNSSAVVFTDKLASHSQTVRPSSYAGSAHTYTFEVGPSLKSALLRAVESVYDQVSVVTNTGDLPDYDVGYKFDLENCQIDVSFQSGLLTVSSKANASISVSLEQYGPAGLEKRLVISGSGFASEVADAFHANQMFAKCVDDAIKEVSENSANVMMAR